MSKASLQGVLIGLLCGCAQAAAPDAMIDPILMSDPTPLVRQHELSPFPNENALQKSNCALQHAILSRVSDALSSGIVGVGGHLPRTPNNGDMRVDIATVGDGMLQVTTIDKSHGKITRYQICQP